MVRIFVGLCCVCFVFVLRWWVWLAGHTPPHTKTGNESQHCQAWCVKVDTTFPLNQHFGCPCVRAVPERQMGEVACFFCVCVLYGCPRLRGSQCQAVCLSSLLDTLGGAEAVPGQTGSRCQALLQPAEATPPRPRLHRTRAYPQASEKPAC